MSNYYPTTMELLKHLNSKAYIGYLLTIRMMTEQLKIHVHFLDISLPKDYTTRLKALFQLSKETTRKLAAII